MAARQKQAIGRRIRELRDAKGWTQQQLAARIPANEVDAQYVSKWERGVYTPSEHLEALATALGVDEGDILAGSRPQANGSTPDVMGELDDSEGSQLDRIEERQIEMLSALARIETELAEGKEQAPPQQRRAQS